MSNNSFQRTAFGSRGIQTLGVDMNALVEAELLQIDPHDNLEREHLADALAWVRSGAQIFRTAKPATPAKHLVSYVAVLDGQHILLVDHKNAKLWLPTGGHVEPNENPRMTVVRELREELGVEVALEAVEAPRLVTCSTTVGVSAGHTDVSLWYTVWIDRAEPIKFDSDEFNSARWFHFRQVPLEQSDPNLSRFFEKLNLVGTTTIR